MKIKKKNPPFPIFNNEYNYFINNSFNLELDSGHNDEKEILKIKTNITNSLILNLLETKKIKLFCRLICNQTRYRKMFELQSFNEQIEIPAEDVIGDISVTLLLIVVEEFDITADENFNKLYEGFTFHYDICNIIGYTNTEERTVEKEFEKDENIKSFCSIIKDNDCTYKHYDLTEDRINILLPKEAHEKLMSLPGVLSRTKQALLIEGAITYVIDNIKNNEFFIEDYRWSESFILACQKAGYESFDDENFKNEASYIISQKILNNPTSDAIKEMREIVTLVDANS